MTSAFRIIPVWKYRNPTPKKFDGTSKTWIFFPRLKLMEKLTSFLRLNCLKRVLSPILTDHLLTLFKSIIPKVRRINLDDFNLFIHSVRELLWYGAPHHVKFKDRSCTLMELHQWPSGQGAGFPIQGSRVQKTTGWLQGRLSLSSFRGR